MDLLARAAHGFDQLTDVPPAVRQGALKSLETWLTHPDFAAYRPQLSWLIEKGNFSGLLDRFYQILPFGTGGRRGAVGIGPNRMNLWTLGASVQGHCAYLKEKFPGRADLSVCLAYDVRQFKDKNKNYCPDLPNPIMGLSSRDFAAHAARIYAANGIKAWVLPAKSQTYLATPELSFLIRYHGAQGGLNISASHNPPDDNGGKFYEERGAQPVPPDDQIMADLVEKIDRIKTIPWDEAESKGLLLWIDDASHKAYIDLCLREALVEAPRKGIDDFKVVFTPLHGVGSMTAMEVLEGRGFRVIPVAEQMTPDGQFPNVTKSPNPEVPESLDRAGKTALANQADLVLATDPDADRLGGLFPNEKGEFLFLNGQRMAALITWFKLEMLKEQGRLQPSSIVVKTEVTTTQITRIAEHFRVQAVTDLLVGFKYIADVIYHLESTGRYGHVSGSPADFVIGTEESHGALTTPLIRDKDAGGAALLMAECALELKRRGSSVCKKIEDLARQFGHFHNTGINIQLPGLDGKLKMGQMLDSLRTNPPKTIAGLPVTHFEDLRDPHGKLGPIRGATDAASRNVLIFQLGDGARAVMRPSGTEPKAKIYIEANTTPMAKGETEAQWSARKAEVEALVKKIGDDFTHQATARVA